MNSFKFFVSSAFKINLRRCTKDLARAEEEAVRTIKAGRRRCRFKRVETYVESAVIGLHT